MKINLKTEIAIIVNKLMDNNGLEPLRAQYHKFRNRSMRIAVLYNGRFSARDLEAMLNEHIDRNFSILMVHSSFNHLLPMYTGNTAELIQVLSRISAGQTLAMPGFTANRDYKINPTFHIRQTPCTTGLIPEIFRRMKDVKASLHPTARILAKGSLAEEMVKDHHLAPTTHGAGTPFEFMAKHDTLILGMGKHFYEVLSQVHYVEDLLEKEFPVAYREEKIPVTLINENNEEFPYTLKKKKFIGKHRYVVDLRKMLKPGDLSEWKFHGVPFFTVRANVVSEVLLDAAKVGETLYR